MAYTILQNAFVVELILPFLLVFAIVFAILQKSKILGDGKKQIDAIVALVVGLIFVAFGYPTGLMLKMIPVVVVAAIVLFLFMLFWGLAHKQGDFDLPAGVKWTVFGIGALVIVVALAVFTGVGDWIYTQFNAGGNEVVTNIVVFVIIIIAIVLVVATSGDGKKSDKKD